MALNGNTFIIFNKVYEQAKISQTGTKYRDVGTHEQTVNPDQLWILEESSRCGYYYIKNAFHQGYRLAKWGKGDREFGVYNGQFFEDQLWKFQKEGDYYRIYNKVYPTAKLAKPGKSDGHFVTYDGPNYDDQLWKLVPRFDVKSREHEIWSIDNREGSTEITKEFTVTTGVKLSNSINISTKYGLETALKASLSASFFGIRAGIETTTRFSTQIEISLMSSEERFWSKSTTTTYTAPPGKIYRIVQTVLDFSSPLSSDDISLYTMERVEESD